MSAGINMIGEGELSPIVSELLHQGGFALGVLILGIVIYFLFKIYLNERKENNELNKKYATLLVEQTKDHATILATKNKDCEERQDSKLEEQRKHYEIVISEKNARISKLEDQNEAADRRYADGLSKFLVETIETREAFRKALDDHKREMHEIVKDALNG